MRVIVVGATGNAGTSVLHALAGDPRVDSIVAADPVLDPDELAAVRGARELLTGLGARNP